MGKTSKSKLIIIISIAVLALTVAVFAILTMTNVTGKKQLEANAEFLITCDGETKKITMEQVLALLPKTFDAVMDTSVTSPKNVKFEGVEFKTLFEFCGFDLKGKTSVEVTALDGYASALTVEEINLKDNVFLCIKMDGKPLGKKSENGLGTYLMVVNSSKYSQRWCKHVGEIEIK